MKDNFEKMRRQTMGWVEKKKKAHSVKYYNRKHTKNSEHSTLSKQASQLETKSKA